MRNDSIETLLARHYGSTAPAPASLEHRLSASVRKEVAELQQQQHVATRLRTRNLSRRQAVSLVAIGSAGLGALSLGLDGLQVVLMGQGTTQTAIP